MCWMSSKRCRIRFRSGGMISAVDEGTCDDEASVANKTKPDNQRLDVAVFVRPQETLLRELRKIRNVRFFKHPSVIF